jgi:uncharacterized protein (DUF2235 family)
MSVKRLVVLADGTWNEPSQGENGVSSPTNVVKLATAMRGADAKGTPQIKIYHDGVGARGNVLDWVTGGAFGVGISRNIEDLYIFLCDNYAPGDELWFFGFSRGAYTVRSLAGLIRNSGILKPLNVSRYAEAYALYRDRTDATHPNAAAAQTFRDAYSWPDTNIRFIGVWDTVGALGIPLARLRLWNKERFSFHDVELSSRVEIACQALAADEQRKPFQATLWTRKPDAPATQVLEQAWFPGVHCDVGGGYAETGLSDGALLWMWERAEKAGLAFEEGRKPVPNDGGTMHDSMTLFYRLLGGVPRALGTTNPGGNEHLDASMAARLTQVPGYRPANVLKFQAETPA